MTNRSRIQRGGFGRFSWCAWLVLALGLFPVIGWSAQVDGEKPLTFLFIGNSFTFRHDLRKIFEALAGEGQPTHPVATDIIAYGGRDLFRHYELFRSQDLLRLGSMTDAQLQLSIAAMRQMAQTSPEPAFYTDYWKQIDATALVPFEEYEARDNEVSPAPPRVAARKSARWNEDQKMITERAIKHHQEWIAERSSLLQSWTYVVLQSWQDVSANPDTGYLKYAAKFSELAKKQGTIPILYLTAPYSQNATPVKAPIEGERALKELHLAAALAQRCGALVVPVPLAVYRLQKAGVPLTLRYEKDFHPNQVCAYLTACLFYSALFHQSPEGLKLSEVVETKIADPAKPGLDPDGHPLKRVFSDDERRLLQRTAWESIEAFRKGEY